MKQKSKITIMLIIAIVIQTIFFIIAGINKSYIHMDEAYSLGLASYDKVEIQENQDFYNTWHTKEYYEDYLTVNEDEKGNFAQVYENQKNDVHPPLYYLILRIAMGFNIGSYSKWPGIIVNIIIYIFITIFMYLILQKLLEGKNQYKEKSVILALLSSITLASITNVIYIRMYALTTLNILITTYLHLKLLGQKENNIKLLILIGITATLGSLTHYYYLFYLAMLFIMFVLKYIKEKDYKNLGKYIGTILIAAVISLMIFPYSIKHMFFGYRGQGAIQNLTNISKFLGSIGQYIVRINAYGFNNLLFILIIAIIGILIYKKVKKVKLFENRNKYFKYIFLPTLFYFIIVAIASPWIELRYILPICGISFILVIYLLEELLNNLVKEKTLNIILILTFIIILIFPIISNRVIKAVYGDGFILEPEVMYSSKKDIVNKLEGEMNVPTLYLFNSQNNRFLDDILLFAKIDESYIAKDINLTEQNVLQIMEGKDLSNGMVVFINEGQENDELLDIIKKALGLEKIDYLERLNACDVYYLK